MQTVLPLLYLLANSSSARIGVPCFINACTIGAVSGMPGLLTTSVALSISASVCCPSSQRIPYSSSFLLYLGCMVPISDTNTSYPCCLARIAVPTPLSPAPSITNFSIAICLFSGRGLPADNVLPSVPCVVIDFGVEVQGWPASDLLLSSLFLCLSVVGTFY